MSLRGVFVATKQSHVMRNNFHQVEIAKVPVGYAAPTASAGGSQRHA